MLVIGRKTGKLFLFPVKTLNTGEGGSNYLNTGEGGSESPYHTLEQLNQGV